MPNKLIKYIFDFWPTYELFQGIVTSKKAQNLKSVLLTKELNPALDFGCGTGTLAKYFDSKTYVGLDPIDQCIRRAQRHHPNHTFLVGEYDKLAELPPDYFASCVSWGVLHHLSDEQVVNSLLSIRRILKPRGLFIALEPTILNWKRFDIRNFVMRFDRGAYVRTTEDYLKLLKIIGFCEIKVDMYEDLTRIPYRHVLIIAQNNTLD